MIFKLVTAAAFLLTATFGGAKEATSDYVKEIRRNPAAVTTNRVLTLNPARTVDIIGPIDGRMFGKGQEILNLSLTGERIDIFLNSPGGVVIVSDIIIRGIELAKQRGVAVRCVASFIVASAAFNIWSHCSERVALSGALLLFHPVRVGAVEMLTSPEATRLATSLEAMDHRLLSYLCNTMVNSDAQCGIVIKKYYDEYLWSAEELQEFAVAGYLTIVDDILGTDKLLSFR